MNKGIFSSPKTTWYGILNFLTVLTAQLVTLFDEDLYSQPDWGVLIAAFLLMLGLFKARDNNVTSEQAGARR